MANGPDFVCGFGTHRSNPFLHCLCGEIFYTLKEAEIVIESWRRHYNAVRPHASVGYKPPAPEVFVPALAGATLGDMQVMADMLDTGTPARGA